ncbi:7171_t:CDS:1 [Acaulospora morrowiae]|uniref:Phosphatidylglycerol/phosphatidylinositol transfer protein n=1 Tax=Acaulospora morrowiae TaxID=94023 RepID=A0A9N8W7D4_9GLOM|nr:7171_t:CDS:1 [Acaulospora morrowiae]
MNKNLIFVFILFATLSAVNSLPYKLDKRSSSLEWSTCYTSAGTFPKLNVVAENDPVEGQEDTFTASGPIPSDINSDDQLYMIFIDDDDPKNVHTFSTPVCGSGSLPQCPIKAGSQFSVNITLTVPTVPDAYDIYAVIGNPPDETLACAYTDLWPDPPK